MITRNITVNLDHKILPVRVRVSQFDTMWAFVFTVMYNGAEWTIPGGATVTMQGIKPDGNVFAFGGTVSSNKVTVNCDVQMTACAGEVVCELVFLDSGKNVGTANFILECEAAPKSDEDISSESTLPAYGEVLSDIADLAADIEAMMPTELQEYVDNWLDDHPEATTTVQDGSVTDAKLVQSGGILDSLADLKDEFNEKVGSRYTLVEPTNWLDTNAVTDGELNANGTTSASTTRCYTDFIPVSEGDGIKLFRFDNQTALYRRHIAAYDADKNILSAKGSDSTSTASYSVSSGVSFVRVTFDKTLLSLQTVLVKNATLPASYSQYFAPYYAISSDFLTDETKSIIDKVKTQDSAYGYAFPKGMIRMTIGNAMKWYSYAMATPLSLYADASIGYEYSSRENDGLRFPNETALDSANGYRFNIYDQNLKTVYSYSGSGGSGAPRLILAENLQNCSALVIGDSTVDFDVMTQKMLDYFTSKSMTLTLLGTLGSGTNRNEGRSGWAAQDYLTNKTYSGVVNPFYNPSADTFDFSYYMTNQGYTAPTFVVLQLGINDLYNGNSSAIEPTYSAIQTMIDSILLYDPSIHILLNLPTVPNSDQAEHTVPLPFYQNRVVRYNQYAQAQTAALYGDTKVRCTYCHLILDPATDIRDNVHPTNAGFEKMAREVISQMNIWLNGR